MCLVVYHIALGVMKFMNAHVYFQPYRIIIIYLYAADSLSNDSLDDISVIVMAVCCHILCIEVLQCFLSMVKLKLLQLAGDVETNPGPGKLNLELLTRYSNHFLQVPRPLSTRQWYHAPKC